MQEGYRSAATVQSPALPPALPPPAPGTTVVVSSLQAVAASSSAAAVAKCIPFGKVVIVRPRRHLAHSLTWHVASPFGLLPFRLVKTHQFKLPLVIVMPNSPAVGDEIWIPYGDGNLSSYDTGATNPSANLRRITGWQTNNGRGAILLGDDSLIMGCGDPTPGERSG